MLRRTAAPVEAFASELVKAADVEDQQWLMQELELAQRFVCSALVAMGPACALGLRARCTSG